MSPTERAVEDYGEAIRLDPGIADDYVTRGDGYKKLGHSEKAIADYTEAIRLQGLLGYRLTFCLKAMMGHLD